MLAWGTIKERRAAVRDLGRAEIATVPRQMETLVRRATFILTAKPKRITINKTIKSIIRGIVMLDDAYGEEAMTLQ